MKAIIFCGGRIEDYSYINIEKESFIICADSGFRHAEALKITPDVIIGDNDSWGKAYPDGIEVISCPAEKDYTDTERCIDYALEKGYTEVEIYGGLGGRLDHEFSNYCLLAYALKKGAKVKLIDKYNEIWMEDKPFKIEKGDKKYVSFFPYGSEVYGFSVKGLKYNVENMTLKLSSTLTVSNEFLNFQSDISFENGIVLVMLCNDAEEI